MSNDAFILLMILIVNFIIALIYLIFHLIKKDVKKGLIVFFTFLVFPAVGILCMLFGELINLIIHQGREREVRYDELSFSKKRVRLVQDADVEKELNTVPLEEALILSGKNDRRQTLMNVLKREDFNDYMENVYGAVSSSDAEVSHYAASFVTDTIAHYKAREQQLRDRLERNDSGDNYTEYIKYTLEITESGLFTGPEQTHYVELLDSAVSGLYERIPSLLTDKTLTSLVQLWAEQENDEMVEKWMAVVIARSEHSLDCFKLYARYCYGKGDRESFMKLIDGIKYSAISLDHEALEWVRIFG